MTSIIAWVAANIVPLGIASTIAGTLGNRLEQSKTPAIQRIGFFLAGAGFDLMSIVKAITGGGK